jgi:eukaryotic-like serine/threonine-protein kinase
MNNWKNVEEVFLAAAELSVAERLSYLDSACAGDSQLRAEVDSLLAHDTADTRPFAAMVGQTAESAANGEALIGRRVGAYRITGSLGRGGMGAVYLAIRADDQFSKKVAIKFIRRGMDTPSAIQSFLRERQILASLDHPSIAKLLDGGATADGIPYFVMEYVAGTPIDVYCEQRQPCLEERCELFRRICEAVAYAHRNLVVHRDLKPSNILVGPENAPILLDFGIAKLMDAAAGLDLTHTAGSWILTPDYASPEQVRGRPTTTATDIYSLGIVFYQLLTGVKPYQTGSTTPLEIERTVCEQEPPRPSSAARDRRLAGDLDNIVLMALRKEPERRYTSVDLFSEDVRRYLHGLPVAARESTFGYLARKFVRRNRVGVLAASLTAASLIAATVVTAHEASRAEQARRVAEAQRLVAQKEHFAADRERDIAARASVVATERAREADAQKSRAEKRLSDLVELANHSLFDVEEKIERVPGSLGTRQEVIRTTIKYLDGLAVNSPDDAELLAVLVSSYTRAGDVLGYPARANLGDRKGAVEAYRKAGDILRRYSGLQPRNPRPRFQKLGLHQRMGAVLQAEGNVTAATAEFKAALRIARELAPGYPEQAQAIVQVGIASHDLAVILTPVNPAEAGEHAREAIQAYVRAHALAPRNPDYTQGLASARSRLAQLLIGDRRFDEALEQFHQGLGLLENLLADSPRDVVARAGIAKMHLRIAVALGAPWQSSLGKREEALGYARKARAAYEELALTDPSNRKAQADLATALVYAGAIDTAPDSSLPLLRRAVALLQELCAAEPKQVDYRSTLALAHEYVGHRLRDADDLAGSTAEYRQSLQLRENPALAAMIAESERRLKGLESKK